MTPEGGQHQRIPAVSPCRKSVVTHIVIRLGFGASTAASGNHGAIPLQLGFHRWPSDAAVSVNSGFAAQTGLQEGKVMKEGIHPDYHNVTVHCACGSTFETRSTIKGNMIRVEICSSCHPFFTGKQKLLDTAGRVERFQKKYADKAAKK